jgi:heat shock protein HtpX
VVAPPAALDAARAEAGADERAQFHRSRRRAVRIAAAPAVVVLLVVGAIVVPAVSPLVGLVAGVAAGVVWWVVTLRGAQRVLLRALRADMAEADGIARAENLVDGLCATMGLASPDVLVIDDDSRNAIAIGRRPGDAVLVVTSGLLATLPPESIEGVLAHELTHIKSGEVAPATVAAAVLLPLAAFAPSTGDIVHRWAGRGREFRADADAVRVTRYPPGLRHALATMIDGPQPGQRSGLTGTAVARATRWLWTVALPDPAAGDAPRPGAPDAAVGELDAVAVRIAALDEW